MNILACSRCRIRPATSGKKTCSLCLEYMQRRRIEWKKAGLCSSCGKATAGKSSCLQCLGQYRLGRLARLRLPNSEIEKARLEIQKSPIFCACCGVSSPGSRTDEWFLDHDRKIFRGLLCAACNTLLGFANDRIEILKSAIRYLGRFQ
jgi:hypothetical protein